MEKNQIEKKEVVSAKDEIVPKEVTPKIFLVSEINLIGLTWEELGLKRETSFSEPLLNSWVKWIRENNHKSNYEVVPCLNGCREFYKWIQTPAEEIQKAQDDFFYGNWLKISFNLRRVYSDKKINEYSFEWDGNTVLLDGKSKMFSEAFRISPETKTLRGLSQKELNSALVTLIYRSALDPINKMIRKSEKLKTNAIGVKRLVIRGHQQLSDVVNLMEMIRHQGVDNVGLDFFNSSEAHIVCTYSGEEKSFMDLLSRLKELKSLNNFKVVNEIEGNHYVLKLSIE